MPIRTGQLRRIHALPTAAIPRDRASTRLVLRVGIIAATSASFAAGNIRYAPDDACPDVRLGDRTYPNNCINLIYLLIPTAEERS
jgi:hypothetical protein